MGLGGGREREGVEHGRWDREVWEWYIRKEIIL